MDEHTAHILDDLREAAAEVGLTARIMPTDEFQELGRRAWLARGSRFHITRSAVGYPPASSWWVDEEAARDRFHALVEEFGGRAGACIALVDEAERTTLAAWPDEA